MQLFAKHLQRGAATCAELAAWPVPSADVPAPFGVVTDKDVSRLCGDVGRTWLSGETCKSATNLQQIRSFFAANLQVCLVFACV